MRKHWAEKAEAKTQWDLLEEATSVNEEVMEKAKAAVEVDDMKLERKKRQGREWIPRDEWELVRAERAKRTEEDQIRAARGRKKAKEAFWRGEGQPADVSNSIWKQPLVTTDTKTLHSTGKGLHHTLVSSRGHPTSPLLAAA